MTPQRISHYPRRDGPLPDGAKWVGRPSRWGNPWKVERSRYIYTAMADNDRHGMWTVTNQTGATFGDGFERASAHEWAVFMYGLWAKDEVADKGQCWVDPLLDATALACSCPLHLPCHVDVLLELLAERR